MVNITALSKLEPLLKQASFTAQEARYLGVSASLLAYYVKKGELIRLGYGVYRGVNATVINDFRWEDLVDAIANVNNGVVCLVSALALYELTEEIPRQHWIAISNTTRHRANRSVKIVRLRNVELGRTYFKIDSIRLPIFDRERTIVDSFRYLGVDTAIKALRTALEKKGNERINLEKLRLYSKKLHVNIEPYILGIIT